MNKLAMHTVNNSISETPRCTHVSVSSGNKLLGWRSIVRHTTIALLLCGLCKPTMPVYSQSISILVYVQTTTTQPAVQETNLVTTPSGTPNETSNTTVDDTHIDATATIDSSHRQSLHQLANEQKIEELRLAIEEGIMTTLFDRGYFVINSQPIGTGLSLNETTTSLWLRSLASDLGVNHLLFVDYRTYLNGGTVVFDGGYQYIEIARPGNLKHNLIVHSGSGGSSRKTGSVAKNYGINIVNEILTN